MIDWTRVQELKGEFGEEGFGEVVEIFVEETAPIIERLAEGRSADLAADLHFVKGSADNMGLSDLTEMCRRGEAAAATGAPPDVTGLRHAFEGARTALTRTPA